MIWSARKILGCFLVIAASTSLLAQENISEELKKNTRLYLTAGGTEYVENEGTGVHSPFSYKFLEGLRTYGAPDSILTLTELFQMMEGSWSKPTMGKFGENPEGSDFFFVAKKGARLPGAQNHAIIIGTDKYDRFDDLKDPTFDATAVARELYYYGFQPELLLNPNLEDVLNMVVQFTLKEYGPHDQLVIFLAGRGEKGQEPMTGRIICKDTSRDDPNLASSLPHDSFLEIVDHIPCKHILIILDSASF